MGTVGDGWGRLGSVGVGWGRYARDLETERDIEDEYEMAINQVELEIQQQDLLIDEFMSQ